jgi:hypothetical protein
MIGPGGRGVEREPADSRITYADALLAATTITHGLTA